MSVKLAMLISIAYQIYQKFARDFLDFARTPDLCKSTNKHAGAIFVGAPAHCPNQKKSYKFVQLDLLDIDRVFLDFARAPADLGEGSKFGLSTDTLFDSKNNYVKLISLIC